MRRASNDAALRSILKNLTKKYKSILIMYSLIIQWPTPVLLQKDPRALSLARRSRARRGACLPGAAPLNVPFERRPRILLRPLPGFYVLRLRSGAPLVPAVIYQLCPMVVPQPALSVGPHPDEWCRPLDRSPRYEARVNGKRVDVEKVWTARSLRPVTRAEFEFRIGPLRRWAQRHPTAPEARPDRPVDLSALPSLF